MVMKSNYKIIMDRALESIKLSGARPSLLLHVCCAPCSTAVLEILDEFFDLTIYFYNPNISPAEEYYFRLDELKKLLPQMGVGDIEIVSPRYDVTPFEEMAKGLEDIPEGGERCRECYRLRLENTISYAAENGFEYVTTTLSVSPHKRADWLNEIGEELGEKYGVKYLVSDFKKCDGYKRSCLLSAEYNLYRQNYCGCIYSKAEAEKR